jgi:hypothetical protein
MSGAEAVLSGMDRLLAGINDEKQYFDAIACRVCTIFYAVAAP